MEITRHRVDDFLELQITGRLDAFWSDHLRNGLAEVVREGAHQIQLNLAAVTYMSSAGIRVLLQFYKQLKGIQGSFVVSDPSEPVKKVLELAGLEALLIAGAAPQAAARVTPPGIKRLDRGSATFETLAGAPGAALHCRVMGDPELLLAGRFRKEHCHPKLFPDSTFAVGLGAFGSNVEACRDRFGEFLAVAGTAAYLPTDGTNVPDYLVASGTLVPELQVLYGLACEGQFAHVAHFEAKKDAGVVTLTELVEAGLEIAGTEVAGMAIVAESAGLVGAALRHSPALSESETTVFEYPQVRQWLSFTTERVYARCLTVVVGVAARSDIESLAPMLRPLGKGSWPTGHFHAATFSYRPLKKGEIDLKATVVTLFEVETLHGVLHLLSDDREISAVRQSEFVRGACWIGPISTVEAEGI